ncbi:MAG TPA: FAD-dependent oxidoreductase [Terracidiphilus sp.]|jgi:glycine/D-amino acid oxidase-like deaminating enzyme|nr:FAD-dependent oxidoreductase [Terracidiphilus sp.]
MNVIGSRTFDVVVGGGGIVGAACAQACAEAGLRVALVERQFPGSGATGAGMGHIVVMDDSEAQFALTRRSQQLWHTLRPSLPDAAEFEMRGTIWVAADEEEFAEAERKLAYLDERDVPAKLLTSIELASAEPNLRTGLAGGMLVPEDAVVYPPVVALHFAKQLPALGSEVIQGRNIVCFEDGEVRLDDGTSLRAPRLVNAMGADAIVCTPGLPVKKRKGHLAITDRYPDFVRHQLVELGYLKSAHSLTSDSVAFNVQPRLTGQILIGSSRQYGNEDSAINQPILAAMLQRASFYMPAIGSLKVIRVWTGFRAATPDKLPLIGPVPGDATLYLATGHEGLGITTSLATAELLAAAFTGATPPIAPHPYLPSRFSSSHREQITLHQEML